MGLVNINGNISKETGFSIEIFPMEIWGRIQRSLGVVVCIILPQVTSSRQKAEDSLIHALIYTYILGLYIYICMYIYIYVCIYTIYVCIHIYICMYMYVCIYIYTQYICIYVFIYIYTIYVYVYIYICVYAHYIISQKLEFLLMQGLDVHLQPMAFSAKNQQWNSHHLWLTFPSLQV